MQSESVIFSAIEAFETCHLPNSKWLNFVDGSLSCSTCFPPSLSPRVWPNPEAQRHCSISVTFDGPGLKQISIPLVDFKRCLNNDASQGRVNEACSGLATSDFKINLISSSDIISAPPFSFHSLTLCVCVYFPSFYFTFRHITPFNFLGFLIFRSLFPESTHLSLSSLLSTSFLLLPSE